jgi:aspartate/methionine/tyrosine aminotransferase
MNPQAEALNSVIKQHSEIVFNMLSDRGKKIYFPKKGILGQSAEAKGKRINATIGEAVEDDGTPMRLKSLQDLLNIAPASAFPYAPSYGRPDLRKKWQEMIYEKNPALKDIKISTPVVTNALTHGLSMVGYLFLDEGDKILMADPCWDNYSLIFNNSYGAEPDYFDLYKNNGFNLEGLRKKLNEGPTGKRVLLLNFPNNPTGYTPTVDDNKGIVKIIKESAEKGNKIIVVCDDAYYGLVYEKGVETESTFSWLAYLHENVLAVKCDGATKEDYVWGFRVGFVSYGIKGATQELLDAMADKTAGAVRSNISNCSNLSQSLLLKAFDSPTYWDEKKSKYAILKSRYEAVKVVLDNNPKYKEYFEAMLYNSGYFMCVLLKGKLQGDEVRKVLLNEFETGVICFGSIIRVAYSSVAEKFIPELFENLYLACKKLS